MIDFRAVLNKLKPMIGGLFFRGLVFQVFNLFEMLEFSERGKEVKCGQRNRFRENFWFFIHFIQIFETNFRPRLLLVALFAIFLGDPDKMTSISLVRLASRNSFDANLNFAIVIFSVLN